MSSCPSSSQKQTGQISNMPRSGRVRHLQHGHEKAICYTKSMPGSKKSAKRPRPSYEDGELRDKTIEKMQDAEYKKGDLLTLIKRAVQATHKPAKT
jgi:hypothetical protein